MKATIIIPTHDHGPLLNFALRSVLAQTMENFEVLIIGDGITTDTRAVVHKSLQLDSRIQFFDHPKSLSKGESYRHEALLKYSTGDIVCYLADDDLWFPDHLERMAKALVRYDIVHSETIYVRPDGTFEITPVDWGTSAWRQWTQVKYQNVVGISSVGHTMSFYRTLPHGWRISEDGYATDHHMWMQILAVRDASATSINLASVASFPSLWRQKMNLKEAAEELRQWEGMIAHDAGGIRERACRQISANWLAHEMEIINLRKQIHELRTTRDGVKQQLSETKKILREKKDCLAKERLRIESMPGPLRALCRRWLRSEGK